MKKTRHSLQASTGSKQLSFLPEPDFNPSYPSLKTLTGKCLLVLLEGKVITHPEFQQITGSWRLAAYVHNLMSLGWPICSHEKVASIDSLARCISCYYLEPKVIKIVRGSHE